MLHFGLVGTAQASISRWALGYMFVHPGVFATALISGSIMKIGAEQLLQQSIFAQLDVMTNHFALVTSNLMNDYIQASEVVANSFLEKDSLKVHNAIATLIDGHNKQNEGTLQKFFDQRDFEF